MKKILALLLALVMCFGVFVACAEEKEPEATPGDTTGDETQDDGTVDEGKTDEGNTEVPPAADSDKKIVKATFDMTDTYTLVIKTVGAAVIQREGIRTEPGKIQCGVYNPIGRRTKFYEFDWASLGLEGRPWEYLGSEVEIDITDAENPIMHKKPVKSVWCVKATDITFPDNKTLKTPDGTTFDLSIMNYGGLRQNLLLNEGGQYLPNWNWVKNCNSPTDLVFTSSVYNYGYYILIKVPQYGKNFITDCPADLNVNDGLEDVDLIPDTIPPETYGQEYVVVANEKRSLGTGEACFRNSIRIVLKESYEAYLAGTASDADILHLNYTDSEDDFLGTVLLVNYNSSEAKILGVYKTGEVIK